MKKIIIPLLISATALFAAISPTRVGPVSQYGQLVAGKNSSGKGQIYGSCDGVVTGKEVQVRGMSLYWSLLSKATDFWSEAAISTMVKDMKIQIIRAAMATGTEDWGEYKGYALDPNTQKAFMKTVVEAAIKQDIYVIIDWHSHEATNQTASSKAFFSEMAKEYGSYDNVIFEIFNEPTDQSWSSIRSYANEIVSEIRKYSDNLVLVGNPNWGQQPNKAIGNEVSGGNIAYTFHYYAGSHSTSSEGANALKAMNAGLSVFVSEWGTGNADGGGNVASANSNWQSWLNTHKLSWANWSASKIDEGTAAFSGGSSPNSLQYTASGSAVKGYLASNPSSYKACPTGGNSGNGDSGNTGTGDSGNTGNGGNGGTGNGNYAQAPLLDDFEDGDLISAWGGEWFTYTDANNDGASTAQMSPSEGNGSAKGVKLSYSLNKGNYQYSPFAGLAVYMNPEASTVDLSQCQTITYDYKGSAHRFRVESPVNGDYAFFGAEQSQSSSWKTVSLSWNDLQQPNGWGEAKNISDVRNSVSAFSWQYEGDNGTSSELWIDNVVCNGLPNAMYKPTQNLMNVVLLNNGVELSLPESNMTYVEIYDMLGNRKFQRQSFMNAGTHFIGTDILSAGTYIMRVRQGKNNHQIRIQKR